MAEAPVQQAEPKEEQPKVVEESKNVEESKVAEESKVVEESVKPEEVQLIEKDVKKPRKEMNLAEVIVDFLGLEKKDIEIPKHVETMMSRLPAIDKIHLERIETFFNKIIADKVVDVKDLPEIVGLMQELTLVYDTLRSKAKASDVGVVFKSLVHLLVVYRLSDEESWTQEEKDKITSALDICLNMCSQMIDFTATQRTCRRWIPCF
jgi:hypothetical protein